MLISCSMSRDFRTGSPHTVEQFLIFGILLSKFFFSTCHLRLLKMDAGTPSGAPSRVGMPAPKMKKEVTMVLED